MSEKQPCRCCKREKPGATSCGDGYGYNRLEGEARQWAESNRFARSEFCVPVKGGKRFGGEDWQRIKCGDGRMGFTTRRKGQSEVQMEVGLDGQFKKKRHTLVRRKSANATATRRPRRVDGGRCGLVSSAEIQMAQRDPEVVKAQKELARIKKQPRRRMLRRERKARAEMIASLERKARGAV